MTMDYSGVLAKIATLCASELISNNSKFADISHLGLNAHSQNIFFTHLLQMS